MSAPESTSAVVGCSSRCASERRCGWTDARRLSGVLVRGDDGHLELGVTGDQPQKLATCVATRARDGDGEGHVSTLGFDGTGPGRRRHANGLRGQRRDVA